MPRGNVDYQKGVIYTIKTGDSLYVGSTTDFRRRKYQHKSSIKTNCKKKIYQVIIKNGGDWDMNHYKIFPCNSKLELEIEEERIRCELNADLNTHRCKVSEQEQKELRKKWGKEWREKNQDKVKEYEANRERVNDKDWFASYYQRNKEYLKEQSRIRYHKKKDKNENKD